jgi:YD repeat-containing protein
VKVDISGEGARPSSSLNSDTDPTYEGDSQFKLLQEAEYLDEQNAVLTRSYVDEASGGASFVQTKVSNDWLGRGAVRESSWPMKNGGGQERVVENTYDLVGNLSQKKLPSGEEYRYHYSSKGSLEKSTWPDGR